MKYAIKLLTQSDLTLFASYYRRNGTSKQKGINLNGDVLAGELFPSLSRVVTGNVEHAVTLDIYGPGITPLLRQMRKIIKPEGGKNWRLNGKLIETPRAEPSRFSALSAEDVAVLGFDGADLPETVSMVVLSQGSSADVQTLQAIRQELGLIPRARSMVSLSLQQLQIFAAKAPQDHPIRLLLPDATRSEDLSVAAEGNERATERLYQRARSGATRPVSASELERARTRAREVGRAGEVLFNRHLERRLALGEIDDFEWAADINAVSPFDFSVSTTEGTVERVDVKSTTGKFATPFHISSAELEVATLEVDFRVARVFGVDGPGGARMKISDGIRELAAEVRAALGAMPAGVSVASVQIDPARLAWGAEVSLPVADDDDDDES